MHYDRLRRSPDFEAFRALRPLLMSKMNFVQVLSFKSNTLLSSYFLLQNASKQCLSIIVLNDRTIVDHKKGRQISEFANLKTLSDCFSFTFFIWPAISWLLRNLRLLNEFAMRSDTSLILRGATTCRVSQEMWLEQRTQRKSLQVWGFSRKD